MIDLKFSKKFICFLLSFFNIIKYECFINQYKICIKVNFNLPILKNTFICTCSKTKNLVSLRRKVVKMKNKTFINECKCLHCQQKIDQVNNSKLYWDKLILRKKLV